MCYRNAQPFQNFKKHRGAALQGELILQKSSTVMSPGFKGLSQLGVSASTPPKRLKWTVIFVATDGSANPVISCAAKMLSGLCLQQHVMSAIKQKIR